jgi:hypothetical protein
MHALRTSSLLARLVLAWFALTLGVAGASPLVHPQAMQIVCTAAGGARIVVVGDDGQAVKMGQHSFDCSLCFAATPPPPAVQLPEPLVQPLAHALKPVFAARIAALVGAPFPPRGPPPPTSA